MKIENTNDNSLVKSINIDNLRSSLSVGDHFSNIKLNALKDANIFLTASSDLTLSASGEFEDLNILAGGKNITLISQLPKAMLLLIMLTLLT